MPARTEVLAAEFAAGSRAPPVLSFAKEAQLCVRLDVFEGTG